MKSAISIRLLCILAIGTVCGTAKSEPGPPEPNPPVHECDRLAGDPNDAARVAPGIYVREIDASKALPACEAAVALHPDSVRFQYHMGRALHRKDEYGKAFSWYRKAAEQGYPPAMSILGVFYAAGGGVGVDHEEAVRWYRKAAASGHFIAMHNLAIRHTDGRGATLDFKEAIKWFRKAAAAGYAASMEGLAYIYLEGREGVAKDPREAVHWLQKAASRDRFDAMYFLALAYDRGEGIDANASLAAKWFFNAIKSGSRLAIQYVAISHPKLTVETRRAFQEALGKDGYFAGVADGEFGEDTFAAVANLARMPQLPVP